MKTVGDPPLLKSLHVDSLPKLGEKEMIDLLIQREKRGFDELYDRYAPLIYGKIISVVGGIEVADELLTEVFSRIWRDVKQFRPKNMQWYLWMVNITRNVLEDHIRSEGLQNEKVSQIEGAVSEEHQIEKVDVLGRVG